MTTHSILIKGLFSDSDWAEVVDLIKQIERRHQDEVYQVVRLDPDLSVAEAIELLSKTFPRVDGAEPEIWLQNGVNMGDNK